MRRPKLFPALLLAFSIIAPALAQNNNDAKATEILNRARAAIGDEAKLKSLQGLSFSGSSRRIFGERETNGEVEFELLMPDKIKRTTTSSPLPGADITLTEVINGDQVWFDFSSSMPQGEPGGGRFARIGGPGGPGGPRGPGGPGGPGAGSPEARENSTRTDVLRMLLGILVIAPASIKAEYSYAGEAKAPDGTADVVEVKGPGNSVSRVYVDQKTHRVLMVSYRGRNFQMIRGGRGGPPGQPQGQGRQGDGAAGQRQEPTPEEVEKRRQETTEQRAPTPEVDIFIRFTEHKNVNGLNLPHLITRSTGSNINEELTINKYKINPKLNPDKFVKKEKAP
jgi:outer membrane lipoprotein-sorting protein